MMRDHLNYKKFGIQDVNGSRPKAAAAFVYKRYIISMSQVFNTPSVVVFRDDPDPLNIEMVSEHESVESAIEWCDLAMKYTTPAKKAPDIAHIVVKLAGVPDVDGPEPDLHEILIRYYATAFPADKARKLADEYLQVLHKEIQKTA